MNQAASFPHKFYLLCIILLANGHALVVKAQESHASSNASASNFINLVLSDAESGNPIKGDLSVTTDIDIQVTGPIVRATVRQTFNNPSQYWAEGIYTYPLPENAAVDHMRLRIGDRVIESEIREKQQAAKVYQSAKASGKQTALLEKPKGNAFTTRVANIEPQGKLTVEFTYQEFLEFRRNGYGLRVPLVATPRYTPDSPGSAVSSDVAPNDIAPFEFRSPFESPGNPVSIQVLVDAGFELAHINSPSHTTHVKKQSDSTYRVELPGTAAQSNRDFILDWSFKESTTPQGKVFYENFQGEQYGLLTVLPPSAEQAIERLPRELIIILDVSGSMSGPSIRQAKQALVKTVQQLDDNDLFNLVFFNNQAWKMFPESKPGTFSNRALALSGLTNIDANGGTEMSKAIALALSSYPQREKLTQIVLITDGAVSNERQLMKQISSGIGARRLFTVGIGSAPNSFLMRRFAEVGKGTATYISNVTQVDQTINALFETLRQPALTGIELRFDQPVELISTSLPDLFAGQARYIAFKSGAEPSSVVLEGEFNGRPFVRELAIELQGSRGVNVEWARQGIERLTQQLSLASSSQRQEIKSRIIDLGIKHQQVSKFTSLVAVDKTPIRGNGALSTTRVRSNLPAGWQAKQAKIVTLAQTATNAPWMTQAALYWLLVALFLLMMVWIAELAGEKPAQSREVS